MTQAIYADRVKETSTTTGTGTLNLDGAAFGFQTFVAGAGTGAKVPYCIAHQGAAEWEVGLGTVTDGSPDTLSRDEVWASSNSGSAVNFSAGTKDVFLNLGARRARALEIAGLQGTRNLLIDGGFEVWRTQAPGTATARADDTYGPDVWYVLTQTGTVTTERGTGDKSRYDCKLTQTQASAQRFGLAQIVENAVAHPMRSRRIYGKARIKCSASQAIRIAILEWTGTADSVTSDVVNDWTNGTFTTGQFFNSTTLTLVGTASVTPSSNTWTDIEVSGSVSASANNLIFLVWTEGTAAQNVTLEVCAADMFEGTSEREFEAQADAIERANRMVYVVNDGTSFVGLQAFKYSATQILSVGYTFPNQMRITPTMTHNITAWDATNPPAATKISAHTTLSPTGITITGALTFAGDGLNKQGFNLLATAASSFSGTIGAMLLFFLGSDVRLIFDARL